MKPVLLTLAGRKRTTGELGVWDGGVVVQLDSSGVWSELAAGDTVAWNIQNFVHESAHILFHIRSAGFGANNTPDRGQLHRSVDQGSSWTDVTPTSGNTEYVTDVAQDANKNMWCITSEYDRQDAGETQNKPSRIYKSTDDGATWSLSHKITEQSFGVRDYPAMNITCHPTDGNIIVVEGTETVSWNFRIWRTTDGGDTWSAAINASEPSPPLQRLNTSGALQHIFNYTVAGRMLYAGSFEVANDELFFLYSDDDGDNWNLRHSEAASLGYGAVFHEETLIYLLHQDDVFELAANVGPGKVTKIADTTDSPFENSYSFHGISRHIVTTVDTLHLGINDSGPGAGATEDPSIYTRPADLSSGWVEHDAWATMESDLGYRVYIAINGVVGATEFEPETPRPPPPDEPPGGGEPGVPGVGEPGVPSISQPGIGLSRKEKRDLVRARKRGRAEATKILRRQPLMITDRIDKSQIPQTAAEPTARKWLCFDRNARVLTNMGFCAIEKLDLDKHKVATIINEKLTFRDIVCRYANKLDNRLMVRLEFLYGQKNSVGNHGVNVTTDHLFLTANRGWVTAGLITNKDILYTGEIVPNYEQQELIDGTMLGDASMLKNRFTVSQTDFELVRLKQWALANFNPNSYLPVKEFPRKPQYAISIPVSIWSRQQHKKWYPNDKKIVPRDIVLTDRVLAVWYMDDGCLNKVKKGRSYSVFCTQGFTKQDVYHLHKKLEKLGIESTVTAACQINISTSGTVVLMTRVGRFVPPSMRYKLIEGSPEFDINTWNINKQEKIGTDFVNICKSTMRNMYKTVYCLKLSEGDNFVTLGGIAHNSFGWLIDAVVQGHKTMTLRDWETIEGVQWKQGELVYAYDQPPSEGGKRIALLRLASEPFSDSTIKLKNSDFMKLGYSFALATQATPPSGRTIEQMWSDMHTKPQRLWVVRFTLERLYDQLAPERGTIGIAERPMGI